MMEDNNATTDAEQELALEGMAQDHKALLESDKGKKKPICFNWLCFRAEYLETKEDKIKSTLSELLFYLLFMIIICILVVSSTSVTMFYYTKIMTNLFVEQENEDGLSFKSITKVEDFWTYAQGPLLENLYWNHWYNKENLRDYNMTGYIYYQSKLLGLPRLRQLRVKSSACLVTSDFELFMDPCYDEYSQLDEDKKPFGKGAKDPNETAWIYQKEEDIDGFDFWGYLAWYSGSGYIQDLPHNKPAAEDIINDLHESMWIQRGTRAVFITFSIYNANTNLFSIVRLACEFPATGGAVPSWSIDTVPLTQRETSYTYFLYLMKFIFVLFILKFLTEETIQVYWDGFGYLKQFWNFFDVLLIILALISIAMYVVTTSMSQKKVEEFIEVGRHSYADFVSVAYWVDIFHTTQAITAFIGFIKMFKFIGFNKTMIQLSMTLSSCAKDLAGFFIMFFIVFLAFTQLGFLLFGSQVEDFSTFMSSFYTLFRIVLGDFNFHELEQANRFLGPIFFMLFVFFVFFVLINMFLAIINDTYSEIKSDVGKQGDVLMMSDYLRETYFNVLKKLKVADSKEKNLRRATVDEEMEENRSAPITLEQWRANLKAKGFSDDQIDPVFERYDVSHDGILDYKEQEDMLADLEAKRKSNKSEDADLENAQKRLEIEAQDFLKYAEFQDLTNRVGRMEKALTDLVVNVENVLGHVNKSAY